MVAATVLLTDNLFVGVDVRREAVLTTTGWTGQAGCGTGVLQKMVSVVHISPPRR